MSDLRLANSFLLFHAGQYRGAAHRSCNLNFQRNKEIPIFFHNGSKYDNHLLLTTMVKEQARLRDKHSFTVIGKTMERFTALSFEKFQVKDSYNFVSTSLDKMVASVKSKVGTEGCSPEQVFPHTLGFFRRRYPVDHYPRLTTDTLHRLLLQKGTMPYEYITSDQVLTETSLPPKEAWVSRLKHGEGITDQEYELAQAMWDCFEMKSLRDYVHVYCLLDTLLLADAFEEFRSLCLATFRLDPCHFLTAPSLSWAAALLESKVKLEVIREPLMLDFLNAAMLGGYSAVHHQYARANQPHLPNYDPEQPCCSIMTVDANNLYGYAMSQALPTHNFAWATHVEETFTAETIMNWPRNGDRGAFLEVDLDYPSHLHDLHNDLPAAPENIVVTPQHLSDHQRSMAEQLGLRLGGKKLVTQLTPKTKYVLHIENLKQYLDLGLVLVRVHRVLTFSQSPWLASYIAKCTQGRKTSQFKFLKDLYKLMVNSVYGKTVENVLKYRNIVLCMDRAEFRKCVLNPLFQTAHIHDENFVTVEMQRLKHRMDKPRYVGIAVLALAKVHLYDFHYRVIKKHWSQARLLFTDTDSLAYVLQDTPQAILQHLRECQIMDFSNLDPTHEFYDASQAMVPGYWKDDNAGADIVEFVGLRAKMYSFMYARDRGSKSTAKGIQRSFLERNIKHENYRHVLFNTTSMKSYFVRLQNEGHVVYTKTGEKMGLNPLNDKRFVTQHNESLAFGHYRCDETLD